MPIDQVVQVIGALLLLAAFVAGQAGALSPTAYPSLVLNAAGSGILAVLAWPPSFAPATAAEAAR
jgi:hypothetical protein